MEKVLNIITTVSNKSIERKLCVKIAGEYYEKNVDCYSINGKWYRKGNPRIYYNEHTREWAKRSEFTTNGIIAYFEYDSSYSFGLFEKSFENDYDIYITSGRTSRASVASKELFDRIPKIWNAAEGVYMDKKYAVSYGYNPYRDGRSSKYPYNFERLYNSEKLIPLFSSIDNSKYSKPLLTKLSNKRFDVVSKYSFGLEFETSSGIIPQHRCKELGLIPLRDGSIGGHEYTTIPMIGEDGINLLMNQVEELKSRCSIDKECSLHVHFGNFPLEPSKILRLHNLCYILQDEVGSLFPKWIYKTSSYKSHGKDYCKKLPRNYSTIDELYYQLSGGNSKFDGRLTREHPQDPRREQKWNNDNRYVWMNLINTLFGSNAKTVEFRLHIPTFNYSKIINWLFICMAILEFADNEDNVIAGKISLTDVLTSSLKGQMTPCELESLISYIGKRKAFFSDCELNFGDSYGLIDLINDADESYKTPYHNEL